MTGAGRAPALDCHRTRPGRIAIKQTVELSAPRQPEQNPFGRSSQRDCQYYNSVAARHSLPGLHQREHSAIQSGSLDKVAL